MSEARRKRENNLIPNSERSPEELRKMGRKGGIKSGESRRKNAQIREVAKMLAEGFLQSDEGKKLLQEMAKVFDREPGKNDESGKENK